MGRKKEADKLRELREIASQESEGLLEQVMSEGHPDFEDINRAIALTEHVGGVATVVPKFYRDAPAFYHMIYKEVRKCFLCYMPVQKIRAHICEVFSGPLHNAKLKDADIRFIINKGNLVRLRRRQEIRVAEKVKLAGVVEYSQIVMYAASITKRSLKALDAQGVELGVKNLEMLSRIFERFDKVMRLEQEMPTEIIKGEVTKERVLELIEKIDYVDVSSREA